MILLKYFIYIRKDHTDSYNSVKVFDKFRHKQATKEDDHGFWIFDWFLKGNTDNLIFKIKNSQDDYE